MLKIVKYPNPVLQKKAKNVQRITKELLSLLPKMEESMDENNGIGLAAPQIGISERIIIVKDKEKNRAFFNPSVVSSSKETEVAEEGCLSLPGIYLPIKRAQEVEVICETPKGEQVSIQAEGLAARIFQHEIDHINGKLIIDRVSLLQKHKIKKQLKRKVNAK